MKKDNWKIWKKKEVSSREGRMYSQRAKGELPEMESSKALCKILSSFYKPEMKVLDVGCGAGHYLRSLRIRLDKDIDYTGLDDTAPYIELAKKAFGQGPKFLKGDIFNLPFKSNTFDIVVCNNVILHLPPFPEKAFSELIKVSKKYLVVRTIFGETNYIVKEQQVHSPDIYAFCNMYSEEYIKKLISKIDSETKVEIVKDKDWQEFDNREPAGETATGTRVLNNQQVSGNLVLDWRFIIIEKKMKKHNLICEFTVRYI